MIIRITPHCPPKTIINYSNGLSNGSLKRPDVEIKNPVAPKPASPEVAEEKRFPQTAKTFQDHLWENIKVSFQKMLKQHTPNNDTKLPPVVVVSPLDRSA